MGYKKSGRSKNEFFYLAEFLFKIEQNFELIHFVGGQLLYDCREGKLLFVFWSWLSFWIRIQNPDSRPRIRIRSGKRFRIWSGKLIRFRFTVRQKLFKRFLMNCLYFYRGCLKVYVYQ